VAKPPYIELGSGERLPIVYEDRSVIVIDKPTGWMLVPFSWQDTPLNLQAAIESSIAEGKFWAKSRNIKYLRSAHRLDAETSGLLLLAKSRGALDTLGRLFGDRRIHKSYLVVVQGVPKQNVWKCTRPIGPDPASHGRVRIDPAKGKPAETAFQLVATTESQERDRTALLMAWPVTGRTHQIRVHLASDGLPVLGDALYGPRPLQNPGRPSQGKGGFTMALRAVALAYRDPFTGRQVAVEAPIEGFLRHFGYEEVCDKVAQLLVRSSPKE
jgi:RluA family pseudouridine synthase